MATATKPTEIDIYRTYMSDIRTRIAAVGGALAGRLEGAPEFLVNEVIFLQLRKVLEPQEIAPGRKHFPRPADGFLTKDDFVFLYDAASGVLHTRNPYTTKDPNIPLRYPVATWVERIQRLLGWHHVQLIGGGLWIVQIPNEGDVLAWPADPLPDTA
jgi:hypothetical protein